MNSEEDTDKRIELRQRAADAKEKVIKAALRCAGDHFAMAAEDPGWEADLHDDMLVEAIAEWNSAMAALIEEKGS